MFVCHILNIFQLSLQDVVSSLSFHTLLASAAVDSGALMQDKSFSRLLFPHLPPDLLCAAHPSAANIFYKHLLSGLFLDGLFYPFTISLELSQVFFPLSLSFAPWFFTSQQHTRK